MLSPVFWFQCQPASWLLGGLVTSVGFFLQPFMCWMREGKNMAFGVSPCTSQTITPPSPSLWSDIRHPGVQEILSFLENQITMIRLTGSLIFSPWRDHPPAAESSFLTTIPIQAPVLPHQLLLGLVFQHYHTLSTQQPYGMLGRLLYSEESPRWLD